MTVAIIMPLSPMSAERFRVASWVTQRLQSQHHWPVRVADTHTRPWSKSHAVNAAIADHYADVYVVCDADVFVDRLPLAYAVSAVEVGAPWAVPHGTVYRLPQHETGVVIGQSPASANLAVPDLKDHEHTRAPYPGLPGGGLFVVSRAAWLDVHGFDERFIGWGSEDVSLGWALDTLAGPHWRGDAPLWHLWHPIEPRGMELYDNQRLEEQYRQANGQPDAMRLLVDGISGPTGETLLRG